MAITIQKPKVTVKPTTDELEVTLTFEDLTLIASHPLVKGNHHITMQGWSNDDPEYTVLISVNEAGEVTAHF
ncbi:hypothetical protein [Shimazuella kribbensis]|uniref:hypothetical protein n=1 Tax=Shimazuella kribbensis TaxID=139808 RepID=UPI00048FB37A|nr:hypothetical protein [Shimazuella kribbensis]